MASGTPPEIQCNRVRRAGFQLGRPSPCAFAGRRLLVRPRFARSPMRKLAITLVVLLVLGVAGALLLPYLLDVNSYRGRIQAELEQRLHRPVTLGQMQLKVVPLAFKVDHVAIAEDPAFGPRKDFA